MLNDRRQHNNVAEIVSMAMPVVGSHLPGEAALRSLVKERQSDVPMARNSDTRSQLSIATMVKVVWHTTIHRGASKVEVSSQTKQAT